MVRSDPEENEKSDSERQEEMKQDCITPAGERGTRCTDVRN